MSRCQSPIMLAAYKYVHGIISVIKMHWIVFLQGTVCQCARLPIIMFCIIRSRIITGLMENMVQVTHITVKDNLSSVQCIDLRGSYSFLVCLVQQDHRNGRVITWPPSLRRMLQTQPRPEDSEVLIFWLKYDLPHFMLIGQEPIPAMKRNPERLNGVKDPLNTLFYLQLMM